MLIDGSKTLAADRATVWRFIGGCWTSCTRDNDTGLRDRCGPWTTTRYGKATLVSAVGPVRAAFDVTFRREVEAEMQSYVLVGKGSGMAGTAQGRIHIALSDIQGGTLLSYSAETVINGKLARIGQPADRQRGPHVLRTLLRECTEAAERHGSNGNRGCNGREHRERQAAFTGHYDTGRASGRGHDTRRRQCAGLRRRPSAHRHGGDGRRPPVLVAPACMRHRRSFAGTFLAGYLR